MNALFYWKESALFAVVKKKKIFVRLVNDIKSFDFGHIQKCPFWPMPLPGQTGKHCCARYLSYLYLSYQCFGMCLTSVGKRRNSVSSNVSEFGRKYFCSPGSNFCFCIKSQCFQIWDAGKHSSKH